VRIEVVYAESQQQWLQALDVPEGATVAQVLDITRTLTDFPHIDLAQHEVGIFGRLCERNTQLKPGDRLEIYRPLKVDAKTARRLRAREQARRES
jgi:uncharacterized protein